MGRSVRLSVMKLVTGLTIPVVHLTATAYFATGGQMRTYANRSIPTLTRRDNIVSMAWSGTYQSFMKSLILPRPMHCTWHLKTGLRFGSLIENMNRGAGETGKAIALPFCPALLPSSTPANGPLELSEQSLLNQDHKLNTLPRSPGKADCTGVWHCLSPHSSRYNTLHTP